MFPVTLRRQLGYEKAPCLPCSPTAAESSYVQKLLGLPLAEVDRKFFQQHLVGGLQILQKVVRSGLNEDQSTANLLLAINATAVLPPEEKSHLTK